MLIIISGPSASGKSTITNRLIKKCNFKKVVTSSTRKPREGEVNGIDYFFLTKKKFQEKKSKGKIIATTKYANNYYGVLINTINNILEDKNDAIIILDNKGVKEFKSTFNKTKINAIYIHRDIKKILKSLELRNNSEGEKERRIKQLKSDIKGIFSCDVIINNDSSVDEGLKQIYNYLNQSNKTSYIKKIYYFLTTEFQLFLYYLKK